MEFKKKLKRAIELGMTPTSAMSLECHKIWYDIVDAIEVN